MDSGRVSGVIDFGDITSRDPAADLAVAWQLLPVSWHDAFRTAYEAAGGPAHARPDRLKRPEGGRLALCTMTGALIPARWSYRFPLSEVPMAPGPHDVPDLYLAPVLLALDARIEELGKLDKDGLVYEVALESDSPDFTRRMREEALIRTITHMIDPHHWTFSWDVRGLRLTHDAHTFVLGVPPVFLEFLQGSSSLPASRDQGLQRRRLKALTRYPARPELHSRGSLAGEVAAMQARRAYAEGAAMAAPGAIW